MSEVAAPARATCRPHRSLWRRLSRRFPRVTVLPAVAALAAIPYLCIAAVLLPGSPVALVEALRWTWFAWSVAMAVLTGGMGALFARLGPRGKRMAFFGKVGSPASLWPVLYSMSAALQAGALLVGRIDAAVLVGFGGAAVYAVADAAYRRDWPPLARALGDAAVAAGFFSGSFSLWLLAVAVRVAAPQLALPRLATVISELPSATAYYRSRQEHCAGAGP